MSIIKIDVKNRAPIYEQIVESVRMAVVRGILLPDEPLPSVRGLAAELAINPNTIQKAYSELERQKITYTIPGRGCFISSDTERIENEHIEKLVSELASKMREAISLGVSPERIESEIRKISEEGKNL